MLFRSSSWRHHGAGIGAGANSGFFDWHADDRAGRRSSREGQQDRLERSREVRRRREGLYGPAGISAALYTLRAGIDTKVVVNGESALQKAENIENYYGFPGGISGPELLENGIKQAKELGADIVEEEVVGLGFEEKLIVKTNKGVYEADAVIMAMGQQRKAPSIPGIKEFEGRGVSYCAVCDGFFYRGKTVAVLGSGEYAMAEAAELKPLADKVIMIENPEEVESFEGTDVIKEIVYKNGEKTDIDGLFVAYGTAGSGDLARKLGIMTEGNKILVDEKMATNVPGIFAAGDCIGGVLQVSTAVAEGAIAAKSAISFVRNL